MKPQEDTPFMFYWTGFEEKGWPPLPIWYFVGDDYCKFSIGEQYSKDKDAWGTCTLDKATNSGTMTFHDGNTASLHLVDDFGAGDREPEADMKWTDEKEVYVWKKPQKGEHHRKVARKDVHFYDDWSPMMFYWTGFKDMDLPPLPIWFDVTKDSCTFSIGEKNSKDPKSVGTCTVDEKLQHPTMTFHDGNTATFNVVDDFGAGDLEPEADMKWTDGESVYVWLVNEHDKPRDPTPFMFYWTGYKDMGLPALPIWFDVSEDSCTFAIGDQYTERAEARGTCTVDDNEAPIHPTLTFSDGNTAMMNKVDDFGAGDLEPDAIAKWTDGSQVYVWLVDS